MYQDPFDPGWGTEVGYSFSLAAWGQGYASELVAACLVMTDDVLRLPETVAFAHPDNAASRRVLAKAGFTAVRHVAEMDRTFYRRCRG